MSNHSKHNGEIGVISRSEALRILGISKQDDDIMQDEYNKNRKVLTPTVSKVKVSKKQTVKVIKKDNEAFLQLENKDDLIKRIEYLEDKVKLILGFLVI